MFYNVFKQALVPFRILQPYYCVKGSVLFQFMMNAALKTFCSNKNMHLQTIGYKN